MSKQPKIEFRISAKDGTRRSIWLSGRDAWTLQNLMDAGEKGCTPIDNPAPRWSAYVFSLRKQNLDIETKYEAHGGLYAGIHGRYILKTKVERVTESEAA